MTIQLNLPLFHSGKVRETYEIPGHDDLLLVVASDRISTHNVVHQSLVPGKGEVLTGLTIFWLREVLKNFPSHLIASGEAIEKFVPEIAKQPELKFRSLVVRRLRMQPIEFIFRNYLTGSLKKAYDRGEDPYELELPSGLVEMSKFSKGAIFTPTEKSETDPPLNSKEVRRKYPEATFLALEIFEAGNEHLESLGMTLVDSKFEVGLSPDNTTCIADEVLTPDSSRLVYTDKIREGESPPWLDKQVARDFAEDTWGKGPKVPLIFDSFVIEQLMYNYRTLFRMITGAEFIPAKDGTFFNYLKA